MISRLMKERIKELSKECLKTGKQKGLIQNEKIQRMFSTGGWKIQI